MKKLMTVIGLLLVMCLLAPVSCGKPTEVPAPAPAPPAPLKMPRPLVPAPAPVSVETEQPTLDQRGKESAERGIWNVETIEEASQITGYTVATPSFIPQGFRRNSTIMVEQPGAGIPDMDDMEVDFPKRVIQVWMWEEDPRSVCFVLTQSPKKFGVGGGEPAEVCGGAGERHLSEADNDRPAGLVLGWNDGNLFYALSGTLDGPLTEEVLHQIACSVGAD